MHHCAPHRRRVNVKKREVLAARMQEKMQSTSEPYFVFVDSDNEPVANAGGSDGNVVEVSLDQSLPTNTDCIRADQADSSNSVDRIDNENAGGNDFLQSDPFQLSENSAVLCCLPQCERELLHSAALQTLSTELEMVVCNTLKLEDNAGAVEPSASPVTDEDHSLLADVDDDGKTPAESCTVSEDVDEQQHFPSLPDNADQLKRSDTASGSDIGQRWPMATSLGNGRLQCNVCRKELRVANYYPHMRRVHKMPSSQSKPITWKVCDRCGYQCQDNYKLRRHVMKHTRYGKFPGGPYMLDLGSSSHFERFSI